MTVRHTELRRVIEDLQRDIANAREGIALAQRTLRGGDVEGARREALGTVDELLNRFGLTSSDDDLEPKGK